MYDHFKQFEALFDSFVFGSSLKNEQNFIKTLQIKHHFGPIRPTYLLEGLYENIEAILQTITYITEKEKRKKHHGKSNKILRNAQSLYDSIYNFSWFT